jgi:dTDP-3-amino-3,4,6-trideoxy-alpha-D-glucose transaminase
MIETAPAVPFLDLAAGISEQRAALDSAWKRVLESGPFILGPELAAFEAAFAPVAGCAHAVGVGNGLDALALALEAAGIGPGDEVVVPAHTFVATWSAVRMAGAVPVPAEPAPGAYNVDSGTLAAAMTQRTRALVVVHLYGDPVAMEPVMALAHERRLVVIEDAAQAHGAKHHGHAAGSFGAAAAFSFYPTKNLGAFGDGGAVATNDAELAAQVRRLRNYGSERKYAHDVAGRNSRLDALQAAILRVRLDRLADWNERRRQVAAQYFEALQDVPELRLPPLDPANEPVWHLFVVRTAARDALAAHLAVEGIETLVHYPVPVYRLPPFAAFAPSGVTPADRLCSEVLSLPIGPHQTPAQTERVIAAIRRYFGR